MAELRSYKAKTAYVVLALFLLVIAISGCHKFYFDRYIGMAFWPSVEEGITASLSSAATYIGLLLFCSLGPLLSFQNAWQHVVPVTLLFVVSLSLSLTKLPVKWRPLAIGFLTCLGFLYQR